MFNTSEGNSTFYGIPSVEQVQRWTERAAPGFQFCLKFPRAITHECELVNADQPTREFLELLAVLAKADRLGPSFLQLGPRFGADRLPVLTQYLKQLPHEFPYAVEVRHESWFDESRNEQSLDTLLADEGIDRCLFDSRPLFQSPPNDEVERASQGRKPKSPFRKTVTGRRPMVRLVGRNTAEQVDPYLSEWSEIVAGWVRSGLTPYFFTHAPDDAFAPELARRFWATLSAELGSRDQLPRLPKTAQQLELFD